MSKKKFRKKKLSNKKIVKFFKKKCIWTENSKNKFLKKKNSEKKCLKKFQKKFPKKISTNLKNVFKKVGPKGPTVCNRRLQLSVGARKKPPVGRQFF